MSLHSPAYGNQHPDRGFPDGSPSPSHRVYSLGFPVLWPLLLVLFLLQDVGGYIKKAGSLKRQFDDDLVRRLIQSIKVINENKIEIHFKSDIVMKQDISCAMTKMSAGAEKRVALAGRYISLVRIKSSDGGLRILLLAVVIKNTKFYRLWSEFEVHDIILK